MIDRAALQKRTLMVLVAAQLFSGAGVAAGIVAGALLAEEMLGSTSGAGLPTALFTLGAAGAAWLIGQLSQKRGRRAGLSAGYLVGTIGGVGIVTAAWIDSVPLLLGSLVIYGAGGAASFQARYAGGDLAAPDARGRAVAVVLVATTLGAVAGPLLTEVTGDFADSLGTLALSGPFMLATVAYAVSAAVIFFFLRPDPLLAARQLDHDAPAAAADSREVNVGGVRAAVIVLVLTQLVMIAIMTMTPIHMRDHHHSLTATGAVIAMHVAAMFLPSPLTGMLVDRIGRRPMILASAVTLVSAGLVAAIAPPESMALLSVALILLGLGWNFGLVAGTALITDSTPISVRAAVQGRADLFVQLSGAAGGLGSGFMVAGTSYAGLALLGGALSLLMLPLVTSSWTRPARAAASA